MKKFLLMLLPMIALVAVGAFAGGDDEAMASDKPYVEFTGGWFFDGGSASDNLDQKEEYVAWVNDYFDIDFKVNPLTRETFMESVTLGLSSGEFKGIVSIFGGSYMGDFYNDGATLDWKPLIGDNPNYKKAPKAMQTIFERDGVYQAIASGWNQGMPYMRSIRKDWLDTLGLDMPKTVYEFYDVIKAFTEDDPDGNGKDDTVGMTSSGVWMMADIFGAFGVSANHTMDHCILPDPHDGLRYNDGFLKPGMKACLEWLRDAYSNGYLDQEIFTNNSSAIRTRMYSGKYGSVTYSYSWALGTGLEAQILKVEDSCDIEGIMGFTSDYAKQYVYAGGIGTGPTIYVMSANTEKPNEMANAFIDTFFGSEIGFFSGYLGIYNKYWKYGDDGEIFRMAKSRDGETATYYATANITRNIEGTPFSLQVKGYRLAADTEKAFQDRDDYYKLVNATMKKGLDEKIYFSYPHAWSEPSSETYDKINADIKRIFDEMVAAAVTGNMTVDEAIASYRKQVGDIGGQKVLDEWNASIGKTSSSVYRY